MFARVLMWDAWPNAKFLGLTATPCRLNGKGFTDLFDVLVQSEDITTFIKEKWLSTYKCYVFAFVLRTNMLVLRHQQQPLPRCRSWPDDTED